MIFNMKFHIITIFFLQFILIASTPLLAQNIVNPSTIDVNNLSDAQIKRVIQEIQTRGLTQDQAIALAKAQGATQTQIDQLMVRIQQQQMNPSDTSSWNKADVLVANPSAKAYSSPKARVVVSEKTKKIFGYQLFNSQNLSFEPAVNIPIPQNYILGISDQISINVWCASQTKYQLTIDKSGAITIPDVGPVYLAGISFEKGQSLIKNRLMAIYSGMSGEFPNTWAEVNLGAVRSMKITVIGEINAPGTYTLPSTASAFNALYLSGGPNENGSFREIKLIRDGVTIKTIDVYDFLINADPAANVQLREQDILFIPTYKTHVEIDGEIKRKGIFELKNNETVSDLIRFAGGFGDKAYTQTLSVVRNNNKEREVRNVNDSDYTKYSLMNGDVVTIDAILNRFSNRVAITGAVFHPGNFELTSGMKLTDLIKRADGLREDAFMNRGLISRIKEDNTLENVSFDLKEVMAGRSDIVLRKEDKVLIRSIIELREARTVNIIGEVIKPETFEYQENMTLGDLIFKAGGFREEADISVIEVTRRLSYEQAAKVTDKMNDIFQFNITRDLKLSLNDASFKLMPFDEVYVRRAPGFRDQGTIFITGEVVYSGTYAISNKNERISNIVKRAGGLMPDAFISGATLTRTYKLSGAEIESKKQIIKKDTISANNVSAETKSYAVGIELNKILAKPGSSIDLLLQPGDVLNIPRELQTVKVSGSVMNPLALTYERRLCLRKYIDLAGGYDDMARKSKTYVIYPNGTTLSTRGFIFRRTPRITPGSEIIVPRKPERRGSDNTMKWITIASAMSSLTIAVATVVNLTK
jgi:protein involved in polysaccharide export with SLBB domain